jgi:enamine deaminase RidA (YjgF/YER057c/UK114 family)
MSRRRVIELPNVKHSAPIPAAVLVDNVLASSALFGADPDTGGLPDRIEDEVAFLFDNIRAVLDAAGATTDDLLRMESALAGDVPRGGGSASTPHHRSCEPSCPGTGSAHRSARQGA